MTTLNIIGAGHLGKTIGYLLHHKAQVKILGVCNQSITSANEAVQFIGSGRAYGSIHTLPVADITMIATQDDNICDVTHLLLTQKQHISPIVFHCSGSMSSKALSRLKEKNALLASAHPVHAFANPHQSIAQFKGTHISLEGDIQACNALMKLFQQIGAHPFHFTGDKSTYHAACCMASNHLVTLKYVANKLLVHSGIKEETASNILNELMRGTLENLRQTAPEEALTGPIKRGNADTIESHLSSLKESAYGALYHTLSKSTLEMMREELSDVSVHALEQVLNQ